MSNIDKRARQVQRYANFGVDMMEWDDGGYVKHSDYLALLDELEHYKSREERVTKLVLDNQASWDELHKKLEAKDKQIALDVQIKARLCRESNSLHDRLREAEKRIAELEARNASTNLPGGFSIEEARTLHTNLVNSHISKAMSGEKMNPAEKEQDLRWIHSVLVSAAWFVKASIEAAGIGKGE